MSYKRASISTIKELLQLYVLETDKVQRKELALKIKNLNGYEGLKDLYIIEEPISAESECLGEEDAEGIDRKVNRLTPGMHTEELPIYLLDDIKVDQGVDMESKCDEILISRKTKLFGLSDAFDVSSLTVIPPNCIAINWYLCILKDIISDCQSLYTLILQDDCVNHCPRMNATAETEYMCSCHPKNKMCSAADYFYHNINFSTMKLFHQQTLLSGHEHKSSESQKELSYILRRLYRLYLHTYYQHFRVFAEEEKTNHDYERFYAFVMSNSLLSEKDMRPFLSIKEMKENVYDM